MFLMSSLGHGFRQCHFITVQDTGLGNTAHLFYILISSTKSENLKYDKWFM